MLFAWQNASLLHDQRLYTGALFSISAFTCALNPPGEYAVPTSTGNLFLESKIGGRLPLPLFLGLMTYSYYIVSEGRIWAGVGLSAYVLPGATTTHGDSRFAYCSVSCPDCQSPFSYPELYIQHRHNGHPVVRSQTMRLPASCAWPKFRDGSSHYLVASVVLDHVASIFLSQLSLGVRNK
jgi:hypothetical protein